MDDLFPSWILPLWIIGAPVTLILLDHLRAPSTVYAPRDKPMPLRTATPNLA